MCTRARTSDGAADTAGSGASLINVRGGGGGGGAVARPAAHHRVQWAFTGGPPPRHVAPPRTRRPAGEYLPAVYLLLRAVPSAAAPSRTAARPTRTLPRPWALLLPPPSTRLPCPARPAVRSDKTRPALKRGAASRTAAQYAPPDPGVGHGTPPTTTTVSITKVIRSACWTVVPTSHICDMSGELYFFFFRLSSWRVRFSVRKAHVLILYLKTAIITRCTRRGTRLTNCRLSETVRDVNRLPLIESVFFFLEINNRR